MGKRGGFLKVFRSEFFGCPFATLGPDLGEEVRI
jgi:hypothetical protein